MLRPATLPTATDLRTGDVLWLDKPYTPGRRGDCHPFMGLSVIGVQVLRVLPEREQVHIDNGFETQVYDFVEVDRRLVSRKWRLNK